jgi:putative transposase
VGDEIVVGGAAHVVAGLSGSQAWLVDVTGAESSVTLAELLSAPGFRMMTRAAAALPPQGLLDSLPGEAVDQARWWERHFVEVITGVPPEAGRGARPRPEYDPAACTLRQRELAKVGELARDGHHVPLSTFQRLRRAYEKRGVWGLVDHRAAGGLGARTDERVLQAIGQAVAEETNQSTGTVARLQRRVEQILASQHGVDPSSVMPARATFYRLAGRISAGRHLRIGPHPPVAGPAAGRAVRHGHRGAPG